MSKSRTKPNRRILIFLFCLIPSCSPQSPSRSVFFQGLAFGTSYHIRIAEGLHKGDTKAKLEEQFQSIIQRLDRSMSNWLQDSQISRLNRSLPMQAIPIDPEFRAVVLQAREIYQKTEGYFDPGQAALFELWSFGTRQGLDHQQIHILAKSALPTPHSIRRHLRQGGLRQFRLTNSGLLRKNRLARLNLSALAKGYLVDRLFSHLKKQGYTQIMVEVGGEVRVGAPKSKARKWKIGIEEPRYDRKRGLLFVAQLEGRALATSGDYRNYFRISGDPTGQLYSHILNPKTGRPKESPVVSASVVGPDCMTADALATTLLILPPERGLALLKRFPDYKALLLARLSQKPTAGSRPRAMPSTESAPSEGTDLPPIATETKRRKPDDSQPHLQEIQDHARSQGLRAYLSPGMADLLAVY